MAFSIATKLFVQKSAIFFFFLRFRVLNHGFIPLNSHFMSFLHSYLCLPGVAETEAEQLGELEVSPSFALIVCTDTIVKTEAGVYFG